MKITLNSSISKGEAIIALDTLISAGNSITDNGNWGSYNRISEWKVRLETGIQELFSNYQDIKSNLFEKGGFEDPTFLERMVTLPSLTSGNPVDPESISRRNRDLIFFQIKVLGDIKEKLQENPKATSEGVSLSDKKVVFNDAETSIFVGDVRIKLPAFKNEHTFCRVMFGVPPNQPVDWSIVAENITGEEIGMVGDIEKKKRTVRDTMYALNERIRTVLNSEDNLFDWKNKTIRRLY